MSIPSLRIARSNQILAALPRDVLERVLPDFQLKALELRQVLQPLRKPMLSAVFPLAGVASMISTGETGGSVEVATIGSEGMVGLPLVLGGASASSEVFVQVPGEALFMIAADFERHMEKERPFLRALLLYTQALFSQVAQCSACNGHHSALSRCARWILQTHDRVAGDEFHLTHEFLGLMLGVRRATVSETAQTLQKRGLIRYNRGHVTLLNRLGLEKAACECYGLITGEFDRLMSVAAVRTDRTRGR